MLFRTSALLFILSLFLSSGRSHRLRIMEGAWKRVDDDYAGMVMMVQCRDLSCKGILTEVPEKPSIDGYQPGHLKWKKLNKVKGAWILEDFAVRQDIYVPVCVEVISKDKIRLWSERFTGFCIGEEQFWERVPPELSLSNPSTGSN